MKVGDDPGTEVQSSPSVGRGHVRKPAKRADYLLSYRPGFPIAVVEAKASHKHPGDARQQATDYAETLALKFA